MIGTYKFKYYGVLKNFDFQKISKDTFPLLIAAKIFDVKELSESYKSYGNYFGVELENSNETINNFYLYNREEYHLKLDVLEDMFDYCEFKCENLQTIAQKIRDLEFNLETNVSYYSKIKYLKQVIYDIKKQIIDRDYYLLYTKNMEIEGYRNWFKFFSLEQIEGEEFEYIFKYLKGESDFIPLFIKDLWPNCYYARELISFCTKKILYFERMSGLKEVDVSIDIYSKSKINYLLVNNVEEEKEYNDIRLDIFKDKESRKLFDFILSRWEEPKNTSFYSKIFKFLQAEEYIIIKGDDNETYREFILSNFTLESFQRIQKKTSEKENNSWDKAYSFFEDRLKEFTQNYE